MGNMLIRDPKYRKPFSMCIIWIIIVLVDVVGFIVVVLIVTVYIIRV